MKSTTFIDSCVLISLGVLLFRSDDRTALAALVLFVAIELLGIVFAGFASRRGKSDV